MLHWVEQEAQCRAERDYLRKIFPAQARLLFELLLEQVFADASEVRAKLHWELSIYGESEDVFVVARIGAPYTATTRVELDIWARVIRLKRTTDALSPERVNRYHIALDERDAAFFQDGSMNPLSLTAISEKILKP